MKNTIKISKPSWKVDDRTFQDATEKNRFFAEGNHKDLGQYEFFLSFDAKNEKPFHVALWVFQHDDLHVQFPFSSLDELPSELFRRNGFKLPNGWAKGLFTCEDSYKSFKAIGRRVRRAADDVTCYERRVERNREEQSEIRDWEYRNDYTFEMGQRRRAEAKAEAPMYRARLRKAIAKSRKANREMLRITIKSLKNTIQAHHKAKDVEAERKANFYRNCKVDAKGWPIDDNGNRIDYSA